MLLSSTIQMRFERERLRGYIKNKGINQDDLARLTGRDIRTIRRRLSPKQRLSPKAVDQICRAVTQLIPTLGIATAHALTSHSLSFGNLCWGH